MLKDWVKKLNKSSKQAPQSSVPEKSRIDGLNRHLLYGLLAAFVVVTIAAAVVVFLRDPQLHRHHISNYTLQMTHQHATYLGHHMAGLKERLEAAAQSEEIFLALADDNRGALTAVGQDLEQYFPTAFDLLLIDRGAPGTTVLKEASGLRVYIEADLLSRIDEDNDSPPESYPYEDTWLTSLAAAVEKDNVPVRGALLLTIQNRTLLTLLNRAVGDTGKITLTQPYRTGNNMRHRQILTTPGDGESLYEHSTNVPGTDWTLYFRPSQKVLDEFRPDPMPIATGFSGLALLILAILFLVHRKNTRLLAHDIEKLCYGTARAGEAWEPLAILEPVAKRMRRVRKGQHDTSLDNFNDEPLAESVEDEKPLPLVEENEFFTDPLLQNYSIIDEEKPDSAQSSAIQTGNSESQIPAAIFRSNDIRGDADEQLHDDVVFRIARSIAALSIEAGDKHVIVGADGRHSSPRIKKVLVSGLLASGCEVIDIGLVTSPLVSFATHTLGPPNGVMITGSHCPGHINGLKITIGGNIVCGAAMQKLRNLSIQGNFSDAEGTLSKLDLVATYRDRIAQDIDIGVPLTVVVDAGHAVGGTVAPSIIEKLGCAVIPLNCLMDPDFPSHDPDPGVDQNLEQLHAQVVNHKADLGIALDGDADRLIAISSTGQLVRPDQLMMIFAKDVLARNVGCAVVYDIKSTRHLATVISEAGGVPTISPTGHGYMREKMEATNAILGGEFSGHIFFNERWFGFDDGIYAAARLLEILSNSALDLDGMLAELPASHTTPEILVPVADTAKDQIISRLVDGVNFRHATLNTLDGLRVDFEDGWGLIRASNTSAALTLRFEANNEMALIRIRKIFKDQISRVVPEIADGL